MVEVVVARADQQRRPLADAPEIFLDDQGLRGTPEHAGGVEMVAGDHHHVHVRGGGDDPVELAQVVMEIGDQQAAHGGQTCRSTMTGVWSDAFGRRRGALSMVQATRRSAAWGDSRWWSMRMPWSSWKAPPW